MINKIIETIKKIISPTQEKRVYRRFDFINHSKISDMTMLQDFTTSILQWMMIMMKIGK